MTDFIPPSDSDPGSAAGGPPASPDDQGWAAQPPTSPQQPSSWGQAPRPSEWGPSEWGPSEWGPSEWGPAGAPIPQPHPGSQPYPYGQQGPGPYQPWPGDPYQGGQYGYQGYRRASQATTALVLTILGLFCCGIPAFVGTIMARSDLQAIRRGETDPSNHGTAQAGFIIGIIASVLWLAVMAFWFLGIILSIAATP